MAVGAENKPKPGSQRGIGKPNATGAAPKPGEPMKPEDLTALGLVGENKGMVYGPKPGGGGIYFTSGTAAQDYEALTDVFGGAYNVWQTKGAAEAAFSDQPIEVQQMFQDIAASRGGNSTAEGVYKKYVQKASTLSEQGRVKTPAEIAYGEIMDGKISIDGATGKGGKGGKAGAYAGPTASVTLANEDELRRTADALGAELLGRAVTEEEFAKVLKRVRGAEMEQPTVTSRVPGTTMTQSGITAEGRQDIMRDILAKGPEAEEFTKATKVVDWFNQWLERRAG